MCSRVIKQESRVRQILYLISCQLISQIVLAKTPIAEEFKLPSNQLDSLVGEIHYTQVRNGQSLLDIARENDIGHDQIIAANRQLNRWIPGAGSWVLIPSAYILPTAPRNGLLLNLAELRIYLFRQGSDSVITYPVSIGDVDWLTPIGTTKIIAKQRDPTWYPPSSILKEHAEDDSPLPRAIAPGDPENPLGRFALRLGIPHYLIHGTDESRAFGIGMRVSHGCIRLYPEDIEELFHLVSVGTPVRIIYQPIKVGWQGQRLYIEIHAPNKDPFDTPWPFEYPTYEEVLDKLQTAIDTGGEGTHLRENLRFDRQRIESTFNRGDGIPVEVGGSL
jgi:L,D-transpeptidase ErfK/SrfK